MVVDQGGNRQGRLYPNLEYILEFIGQKVVVMKLSAIDGVTSQIFQNLFVSRRACHRNSTCYCIISSISRYHNLLILNVEVEAPKISFQFFGFHLPCYDRPIHT